MIRRLRPLSGQHPPRLSKPDAIFRNGGFGRFEALGDPAEAIETRQQLKVEAVFERKVVLFARPGRMIDHVGFSRVDEGRFAQSASICAPTTLGVEPSGRRNCRSRIDAAEKAY